MGKLKNIISRMKKPSLNSPSLSEQKHTSKENVKKADEVVSIPVKDENLTFVNKGVYNKEVNEKLLDANDEKKKNPYTSSFYNKPSYVRPLKAEDVPVDLFVIDPTITTDQMDRYINIILNNADRYILIVLANNIFVSMPLFQNKDEKRVNNKEDIKTFLSMNMVKQSDVNFADIIEFVRLKSKSIVIPDTITLEQARAEEEEYRNARYLSTMPKETVVKDVKPAEKAENKVDKKDSTSEIDNWPIIGLDDNYKSKEQTNNLSPKPESSKYFPWSFKPSKKICNAVLKSINIVGKNNICTDNIILDEFKETRRIITDFNKKKTDVIFYSLNDENIEFLSALGIKRIELLHDKFN